MPPNRRTLKEPSMSDDKTKTGGQDRTRINIHEDYELQSWARKFNVSKEELKAAVQAVGTEAKAVEAHLKRSIGPA
jgi:hypothetical protein